MFGSVFPVNAGETMYLGIGYDASEAAIQFPMPAGTAVELHCGTNQDPGAGNYVYTLRKNNTDTVLAFSLTGTNRKGQKTQNVTFGSGDWMSLRVAAVGGAPTAHHTATLRYSYA